MATKVIMPKQGLQMTEGTIIRWIISEGDQIELGQPLFEIETDKVNIEIESPASGTLLKIIVSEGETVPITETVAIVGEPGEDYSSLLSEDVAKQEPISSKEDNMDVIESHKPKTNIVTRDPSERVFITPRAKTKAAEMDIDYHLVGGSGPEGLIIERDILADAENIPKSKIKTTPVAAKIAQAKGIDLSSVSGTGISGRITKEDLYGNAVQEDNAVESSIKETVFSRTGKLVPFKGMRKVISDRMMESIHGMAQANHTIKVDMTEAMRLRTQLKEAGIKVSYNDILVKVVSKALLEFPYMNSSIMEDEILLKDYVNLGLAVAVDNGLLVPNIKDADLLSLQEIAAQSSEVIDKTLNGKLRPNDYANGTFTITNLGMFDIDEFTAVINPPESGILAVGKIEKTPVVENDAIVIRPIMALRLTYDHRVIDGAPAAQFLQRVKQLLMKPYLLL
ncbi:dihydrolipoamide acetyltransferase family protein [Alkalibaculum bacchi]|uniref:dihydrolipoamide acetyltransferase family protein n=1 Tax=Alkalibaculum bacchi TaxID=645887 RepID=UPI0026F20246|nr:dihydrolipoamide acetyltransferase family protein [Alkalibaculum bacchi]